MKKLKCWLSAALVFATLVGQAEEWRLLVLVDSSGLNKLSGDAYNQIYTAISSAWPQQAYTETVSGNKLNVFVAAKVFGIGTYTWMSDQTHILSLSGNGKTINDIAIRIGGNEGSLIDKIDKYRVLTDQFRETMETEFLHGNDAVILLSLCSNLSTFHNSIPSRDRFTTIQLPLVGGNTLNTRQLSENIKSARTQFHERIAKQKLPGEKIKELEQALLTLDGKFENANKELKLENDNLKQAQDDLKEARNAIITMPGLQARVKELEGGLKEANKNFEEAKLKAEEAGTKHNTEITNLEKRINDLNEEIRLMQIDNPNEWKEALNREQDAHAQSNVKNQEKISDLEKQVKDLTKQIKDLPPVQTNVTPNVEPPDSDDHEEEKIVIPPSEVSTGGLRVLLILLALAGIGFFAWKVYTKPKLKMVFEGSGVGEKALRGIVGLDGKSPLNQNQLLKGVSVVFVKDAKGNAGFKLEVPPGEELRYGFGSATPVTVPKEGSSLLPLNSRVALYVGKAVAPVGHLEVRLNA